MVYDVWQSCTKEHQVETITTYILDLFGVIDCDKKYLRTLQRYISGICSKLKQKWQKNGRNCAKFLANCKQWLSCKFTLPQEFLDCIPSSSSKSTTATSFGPGRPAKQFSECSLSVKKRKMKKLLKLKTQSEIALAAEMSLRASGKRDAAVLIKEITASPRRATVIKKARRIYDSQPKKMSPEQALALIVNTKLSTHQYKEIRNQLKSLGQSVYPPYYLVKTEKKNCCPPEEAITVTEISAEVNLQELLNLTATRIVTVQSEVFDGLSSTNFCQNSFMLISKWGCDGSSAQSRYKQKLNNPDYSDEHLFAISFVPLRLVMTDAKSEDKII